MTIPPKVTVAAPGTTADAPLSILMIAYTNYETDPRVIRAAEAAREGNFAVDVIALRRRGQPPVEIVRGVRVFRLPQTRYRGRSRWKYVLAYIQFFLRCAVASTRLFVSQRYDIVHVHNMPDVLVFSALVPRILGTKVLLDIHDPMPETFASKFDPGVRTAVGRLLAFLERLSIAFAHRTITVSEPVKAHIALTRRYPPDSIGVVANFADEDLFQPLASSLIDGKVRFVFHGTILERYGLRTLVDAVARVRHRERIHVRIIGEGDFSATLTALIAGHNLAEVIEFDNRLYPVHELPHVLADCHVGLIPLDTSGIGNFALPLKLLEYTDLGLPAITARNAAIEYYFHPDDCMFFDSGDAKQLAELLDGVVEQPDSLLVYRERLDAVRERLSWRREKAKYVAMLRHLAGQ